MEQLDATDSRPAPPAPPAQTSPAESTPPAPKPKKHLVFGVLGLVIGTAIGAIGGQAAAGGAGGGDPAATPTSVSSPTATSITDAVSGCGVEYTTGINILDEGSSLQLSTAGKESLGATYDEVLCVLEALDVPESVVARFGTTSALDGQQTADWNGFTASWGYHPDSGLDVVVETLPQD